MLTNTKRTELTIETETVIRVRRDVRCPACGAEWHPAVPEPPASREPCRDPNLEEPAQ